MEDFKNRLLKFSTGYLGLSQSEFEKICNIGHGIISSIKVKGPSVDVLAKISNTYPELDLNWLITGRGEMLIKSSSRTSVSTVQNDIHDNTTVNINYGELKDAIVEAIKEALNK